VTRRAFCPSLRNGSFRLDPAEAHHVRDVLRATVGDRLELFDAAGRAAEARIDAIDREGVSVSVQVIREANRDGLVLTVATAVPKADRADWLVEKLSELGVARWVPLETARSVVHPAGESKFDRWRRIAIEAAKQSKRSGVMEIAPLTELDALPLGEAACVLSTRDGCGPLATMEMRSPQVLLIGPEGGWTAEELASLAQRGAREVSLTSTVLRVETAAIVAAGIVILSAAKGLPPPERHGGGTEPDPSLRSG
jgi:16S rRNA (uracil1498-N3)-methyltransferase